MGLVWDRGESDAFKASLSARLDAGEKALSDWAQWVHTAIYMVDSKSVSGETWNIVHSFFVDRFQPIVSSAQSCCAWTRTDLDEYGKAEEALSDPEMNSTHLDEYLMEMAAAGLRDQIVLLSALPPWQMTRAARDYFAAAVAQLSQQLIMIESQIAALRAFAGRVAGVFSGEVSAAVSLNAALSSLHRGSLSAAGVYVPAEGDSEAWLALLAAYSATHPPVVTEGDIVHLMLQRLRDEGLLTGDADGLYLAWLFNAAHSGVSPSTICDIVRQFGLTPASFKVLSLCPKPDGQLLRDNEGKTFFMLPPGVDAATAQQIAFMAYIFNAGTGYGEADDPGTHQDTIPTRNSMSAVPYSADEIARLQARIKANAWSYVKLVSMIQSGGGQVAATPNGILMAVSKQPDKGPPLIPQLFPNNILARLSQGGGTTYGDLFIFNIDNSQGPYQTLINIIHLGSIPSTGDPTGTTAAVFPPNAPIDLDRLFHHEAIHAQQWANLGPRWFPGLYGVQSVLGRGGNKNPFEQYAGLADGGYPHP